MAAMSQPATPPPDAPNRGRARKPLVTAHERRQRRRRWLTYGLLITSSVLMINAMVGETGYLATLRARRDYNALMASLVEIRLENQALRDRAQRLKHDPAALEEAARRDLSLTRPGEVLVIVKDAPAPAAK
jgi:cell division protein FtsB